MKNKISLLMHLNTLLLAVALCVILIALVSGFGILGAEIYFGISLTYFSLNVLLLPFIYKFYKKKKTENMVDFSGYVSLFFSYLLFAASIYCLVLFCSTFSFMYGVFPFIIALFMLIISLTFFGISLSFTISSFIECKKKRNHNLDTKANI